jgi:hypothetical protein
VEVGVKKFFPIVLLLSGIIIFNCSQATKVEEDPPQPPEMITFSGASSTAAPAEIAQKASEVNQWFVFIAALLEGVQSETPAINGNIYRWELDYAYGDVKRLIKAVRRSDKSVDWTVQLDGVAGDGTIYNSRTLVIGKAGKNNQSQNWTLFDLATGVETFRMAWSRDNTGNLTLTYTFLVTGTTWQMANKLDHSGSYQFHQQSVLLYDANWLTNGAGSYTDYRSGFAQTGNWM